MLDYSCHFTTKLVSMVYVLQTFGCFDYDGVSLNPCRHPKNSLLNWNTEKIIQRWRTAISVFAHIFLVEGPGNERDNFLYAHAGIASRMAR